MDIKRLGSLSLLLALVLAACSSASPQLIGTYPKQTSSSTYAPLPANVLVVYNAYLELEVYDTDAAAEQAIRWVYAHGGYLVSSDTWYAQDCKCTTLTLAVPVAQFDSIHDVLLGLGKLVREEISSDRLKVDRDADGWDTFSSITVQLRSASGSLHVSPPSWGWDPVHTFKQAFGVFAAIFAFLVDLAIWGMVVVGPFVLMGWGIVALIRRGSRKG